MGPGLSRIFFRGKSSQNSTDILEWYTMCILSVYTLLKVASYYDLSDGFPKKIGGVVGGWVG